MSLFGKKEKSCCDCGGNCDAASMEKAQANMNGGAEIKILGSGCKKCNELEANTREALRQLGMEELVDHVTDFSDIAAYGVMTTPALVFRGKVLLYGKVAKTDEIVALLQKAMQS